MPIDLDELITIEEPEELTSCSLVDLRALRDAYQELENGLSYARRLLQGRLDTLGVELERRRDGDGNGLIERLPDALASHTRGPGLPRPVSSLEPPEWADRLVERLDATGIGADLDQVDTADLALAAGEVANAERELSDARREVHRRIDRVQDELVGRYRSGASVDDLLR